MLATTDFTFRSAEDIDAAVDVLAGRGADSVVTLAPADHFHPGYLYEVDGDGCATALVDQSADNPGRQSLPPLYVRVGAIYAIKRETLRQNSLYGEDVRSYAMGRRQALNIDEPLDWEFAEFLMEKQAPFKGNTVYSLLWRKQNDRAK
jgi:CMP-N,N'-diacetyllegionaminic acid synthase